MKRKVVAICGSVRFWDKMQEMQELLELEDGYVVIGVTPHVKPSDFTPDEEDLLDELHREKIKMADAIFVVNVGGYIGKSTSSEIEFARSLGKEILYLESNASDWGERGNFAKVGVPRKRRKKFS